MSVSTPPRILRLMVLGMLGGVLLMMLGLVAYESLQTNQRLVHEQEQRRQQQLDAYHRQVTQDVDGLHDFLVYYLARTETLLMDTAREQADAAWATAMSLYRAAQGKLPDEQIQTLIVESLRDIRFFQGRGYVFIDSLDGQCILLPTAPELEGTSLWDNRDDTGFYIMRGLVDAVRNPEGYGFVRYRWYGPDQPDEMAEKIAYARHFEPYDWLIGTGDYVYQIEADLKQMALNRIGQLALPAEGYIAVLDERGRLLTEITSPADVGILPDRRGDPHHQQVMRALLDKAHSGGGFLEYAWYRPGHEGLHDKLSLVRWVPETRWLIVAGGYLDALALDQPPEGWWPGFLQSLPRLLTPLLLIGLFTLLAALCYANWLARLLHHYQQHIDGQQTRLQQLAEQDTLTDLPNRWLLGQKLAAAMDRALVVDTRLALLVIDIDRFKNINDSLGHSLGDRVLQVMGQRLAGVLGSGMTLARMGGDEFVLLVEQTKGRESLQQLAEQLLETIRHPVQIEYHQLVVSASIGIALYPDHGANQEVLFRHADTAMYQAKASGRNRWCFYTRKMGELVVGRLQLENDLRQAIQLEEQLFLVYQPQWNLHSGRMTGCEVLVRWLHPRKGLIPPMDFVPLAEESGLIQPLGNWILRTALAQARVWRDQGLPGFTVAVNLSTAQLHANLPKQVNSLLRSYDLPPSVLELEVTETLLMTAAQEATAVLGELKKAGIRIALDDFGTGYSSLSYLSRLPLDVLKIDKSFVDGLPDRQDDVAITRLIIRMAAQLGIVTLAEGVENQEQLDFLRDAGCDLMQGYLKARPLSPEAVTALVSGLEVNPTTES